MRACWFARLPCWLVAVADLPGGLTGLPCCLVGWSLVGSLGGCWLLFVSWCFCCYSSVRQSFTQVVAQNGGQDPAQGGAQDCAHDCAQHGAQHGAQDGAQEHAQEHAQEQLVMWCPARCPGTCPGACPRWLCSILYEQNSCCSFHCVSVAGCRSWGIGGALPPDPPNLLVAAASGWPLMAAGWLILAANVRQQQAEDSGGWGR